MTCYSVCRSSLSKFDCYTLCYLKNGVPKLGLKILSHCLGPGNGYFEDCETLLILITVSQEALTTILSQVSQT